MFSDVQQSNRRDLLEMNATISVCYAPTSHNVRFVMLRFCKIKKYLAAEIIFVASYSPRLSRAQF